MSSREGVPSGDTGPGSLEGIEGETIGIKLEKGDWAVVADLLKQESEINERKISDDERGDGYENNPEYLRRKTSMQINNGLGRRIQAGLDNARGDDFNVDLTDREFWKVATLAEMAERKALLRQVNDEDEVFVLPQHMGKVAARTDKPSQLEKQKRLFRNIADSMSDQY